MAGGKDEAMILKIIGACMILCSCGGLGLWLAVGYLQEERTLRQLICLLDYMECELQYRLTPLPELCRLAAAEGQGTLSHIFLKLAHKLEDQLAPNVAQCMDAALEGPRQLPKLTKQALHQLGQTLGRFDLQGQLRGLEGVRQECRRNLDELYQNNTERTRRYQTLGLCAGAALIILFI